MKVTITLDKEQARVVEEALDFYSRWLEGQFEEGEWLIRTYMGPVSGYKPRGFSIGTPDFEVMREHLDIARVAAMPGLERSAYIGIAEAPEVARIAYDVKSKLAHDLAWHDNPKGGLGVHYHEPMHLVKRLPLPEVKIDA